MRILIIRTSAMGDIVHCLPVLTELRRRFPKAKIGWIVEAGLAPILEGHADLDEVLPVGLRTWRRRPFAVSTIREIRTFLGQLRRFAADLVLDLMGNHKSGVLGALSMADRRIGAARGDRREPSSSIWISEPNALRGEHVVDRAMSLLEALEVTDPEVDFGPDKLFREARPPAELPSRYFLIHPGAAWANKRYPPSTWGEVAQQLSAHTDLRGVVVSAPGEEEMADSAIASSVGALEAIATPDLPSLAAVLRGAEIVLGGDTGPLHLATALGRRVLCVMGPTDPAVHGPYGRPRAALFRALPCSFCYRRFDAPKACLTTISPSAVAHRAVELLGV